MKTIKLNTYIMCCENKYGKVLFLFQADKMPPREEFPAIAKAHNAAQPDDVFEVQPWHAAPQIFLFDN
jgi:hypothetical protein